MTSLEKSSRGHKPSVPWQPRDAQQRRTAQSAGRGRPPQGRPQAGPLDSVGKVITASVAGDGGPAYGEGMHLSEWAEGQARSLLEPLGRRWRHAKAVADAASTLAFGLPEEDADVLMAAAYLHDVGYAPELVRSGFHPLDGAQHLLATSGRTARSEGTVRLAAARRRSPNR